jgi:hypothetical protein
MPKSPSMTAPEQNERATYFWVNVIQETSGPVHREDRGLAGLYAVAVDSGNIPPNEWEGAALDVFHDEIGIKVLDDFSIGVYMDRELKCPVPSVEDYEPTECYQGTAEQVEQAPVVKPKRSLKAKR